MANSNNRFVHDALGSDDIRLVELAQTHPDRRPPLSLTPFPRSSAPEHFAVSYYWGQDVEGDFIHLNGTTLATRPSLHQLLLGLRKHCSGYPRWQYFWIEAICIDQSNGKEKSIQVRRMDETYRNAAATVVWLGAREHAANDDDKPVAGRNANHTAKLVSSSLVDEIFSRPYWSCIWIIQELVLAKDIVLLYGNLHFTWRGLTPPLQPRIIFGKSKWRHSALARLMLMVGGITHSRKNGGALGELMRSLAHSECADPRNRVFALLSLVEPEERALLGTIFPDYTMSHEKVMLVTMTYLKQIYAPPPFMWVFKPEQVWRPEVFGPDRKTWQTLWKETEGHETPHDLSNYAKVWNLKSLGKLLRLDTATATLKQQKTELRGHRRDWYSIREDALRKLARDSQR